MGVGQYCAYSNVVMVTYWSREAWHKLGDLSEREAMQSYVELVSRLDPAWAAASHPEGEQDSKVGLAPVAMPILYGNLLRGCTRINNLSSKTACI